MHDGIIEWGLSLGRLRDGLRIYFLMSLFTRVSCWYTGQTFLLNTPEGSVAGVCVCGLSTPEEPLAGVGASQMCVVSDG